MAQVSAVIGRMDEVAGAIAAAVEQQTATTRELAANVQAVAGATDQTARAMEDVAGVADKAGGVSRDVQEAADGIGQEAEKLLSEVNGFLVALKDETGDKRGYERVPGQGASVLLRIPGQTPARVVVRDISRGGVVLLCDLSPAVGSEVGIELPNTGAAITARVTRSGNGVLALVFPHDTEELARIDRALETLTVRRQAA
jgi:methyl-accepting chemotaxis protein